MTAIIAAFFSEMIEIEASRAVLTANGVSTYFTVGIASCIGTDRSVVRINNIVSTKAFCTVTRISTLQAVRN